MEQELGLSLSLLVYILVLLIPETSLIVTQISVLPIRPHKISAAFATNLGWKLKMPF